MKPMRTEKRRASRIGPLLVMGALLAICLSVVPTNVTAASTVSISSSPALKQVDPGVSTTFSLTVQNIGAASDVIELDITGTPKNWTVTFADDSLEVAAGKSVSTTLSVKPTKDAATGDTTFNITATSTMATGKASVLVKVRVKQVYKLDLQIAPIGAVSAGNSASIVISLRNDGNGQDHVTLSIIPNGASTYWAQAGTKTFDLGPGQSTAYTHIVPVAKDITDDRYQFIVRARSSGTGVEETKSVDIVVENGAAATFTFDTMTLTVLAIVVFIVLAILAAAFTPKRKADVPSTTPSATAGVKKVKRKKIRAQGPSSKDLEEHKKHLERIEKRIDELHDKVEFMHKGHSDLIGHFEEHLTDHHGKKKVVVVPPPLPPPPMPPKEGAVLSQETEAISASPGPHPEALHPEGPPENMSLGDEHGELAKKTGSDKLPTVKPAPGGKKCPKCSGDVEPDWMKCPSCSSKL